MAYLPGLKQPGTAVWSTLGALKPDESLTPVKIYFDPHKNVTLEPHTPEYNMTEGDHPDVPEHLQAAYAAVKPFADRQLDAINQLRERGGDDVEEYLADQGYVPRYVVGKSPKMDLRLPGQRDVLAGRGDKSALTATSKSQKQRQFYVVTDSKGAEHFQEGPPAATDIHDQPYQSTRQATVKEIEANTDVRYHKNALANFATRALEDEKVLRNLEVLDELKKTLSDQGLAFRKEWRFKDADGKWQTGLNKGHPPPGFIELAHVPQLRGTYFDPKIAHVLEDYRPRPGEEYSNTLSRINRAAQASLFITPFPHIANVGGMWTVGRGWDWLSAPAAVRGMKAGSKAIKEVLTMGPEYQRMLREGSGLRSADDATRNFYDVMLKAVGARLEHDPKAASAFAKAFGIAGSPVKALYNASHKMLWSVNDMLLLQRQFELEAKGMDSRQAIKEAERWIANYRVPAQVAKSRFLSQLLTRNELLSFGRYDYGKWRALGEMVKPFVKGDVKGSADAAGKMAVLGAMMAWGYPMMDKMVQAVTGNENARVHRGGEMLMVDAATRLSQGDIGWAQAMGSMISPSPVVEGVPEILSNRNLFTGQDLINPESSTAGKVAQGAEAASQFFLPGQLAVDTLKPGGAAKGLAGLAGISLPDRDPSIGRAKAKKYERGRAKTTERKTP